MALPLLLPDIKVDNLLLELQWRYKAGSSVEGAQLRVQALKIEEGF